MAFSRPRRLSFTGEIIDDYDHFDDSGRMVGTSRVEVGLLGGERQVHYDETGARTGWSRREDGLVGGERVVHYDESGTRTGWTVPDTGILSNERRWVEYDADGTRVWVSRWIEAGNGEVLIEHRAVGQARSGGDGRRSATGSAGGGRRLTGVVVALLVTAAAVALALVLLRAADVPVGLGALRAPASTQSTS